MVQVLIIGQYMNYYRNHDRSSRSSRRVYQYNQRHRDQDYVIRNPKSRFLFAFFRRLSLLFRRLYLKKWTSCDIILSEFFLQNVSKRVLGYLRRLSMAISYNNLWKTLIDKGINKSELCKKVKISTSTMAKMTNGEPVNLSTLERICKELDCSIEDVVEIKNTEDIQV